ncbi:YtcA family lipoprotein [Pseudomonas sp. MWU13-2105]|uniref:YtcA family lipoprotein n=1 Tax=Pseudomonas sp. MWU13-2105 TaxID=2935074 RepID=UPI00200CA5E4|nr:YtcA family lipoprotein [Pseudomonas sp. MWU13-2105]
MNTLPPCVPRPHGRLPRGAKALAGALAGLLLAGCKQAPSISVIGAYFPDWLFCAIAGVLLTFLVRAVLLRTQRTAWLRPWVLSYPLLALLFSLLSWLVFF